MRTAGSPRKVAAVKGRGCETACSCQGFAQRLSRICKESAVLTMHTRAAQSTESLGESKGVGGVERAERTCATLIHG